jgi:tetratricopeptide (TPR) repeat protein
MCLQPEPPDHHSSLGYVLTQVGRPVDAEIHCRQAIRLQSDFIDAHLNLAMALWAQSRLDEALQCVEEALRIDPVHPIARYYRALCWLQQGNFAQGWPEYEWRWKQPNIVRRPCREPLWDSSPLHGRTILLWAEQGLGDTLQTIRFARLVQQRGAKVVVECQAPLVRLLSRCAGIDQLVPSGSAAPAADVQAPLFSLPWLLGITLEMLPGEVPYLFADPALVEQWRRELRGESGFKIGIAWQGNPLCYGDCMRSIPLKHFAALARLPGVRLFSLQKGFGSEQLRTAADSFSVVDLGCRLDEQTGAFMDTAAVMANLDLVITSDTSVAHLAGGLGRPVWVALGIGCDWRYFQHREDNPWYPTMRLFRQKRFGDWDEVFNRMADELRQIGIKKEDIQHPPEARHTNQRSFCTMTARISLTMIVKNEAAMLDRCLASVRDLVDEIIVVDTGSSDHTKDIAGQHGARVFDLPWPDSFAAARNESIRHANGQWLLWLDADEYFDDANRDKLRQLLADLSDDTAYVMRQRSPSHGSATLVGQVRLFRNHPAIRWDYRVHEQILPSVKRAGHAVRDTDIFIEHSGYLDPALRHKKLERNLRLLHLDMAERPNDPFTLFNLGWAFADLGRCADAIPLLQRSLQHSHNADSITPKLYSLLTQCHRRLGQFAEAWTVCQAGHVRCPDDAELLFLKGQLCHQRGDHAGARACWMQLLQGRSLTVAAPMDAAFTSLDAGLQGPLVRHHLAVLDREEGHLADAEKQWRTILDDTPDFHPARIGLAELYLRQERWPELETFLAELEPHAPLDAAVLRARMNLARKDFATARQLLEDTIRQAPHHLPAHVILSHVLLQSGDERAAEPQLRRIVEMDPGQAESWRNLAVLYRNTQRLREAIAAAKAGCLHCPHHADLLLLQGALLREGGDVIDAESCLLRVLETAAGDGPARQLRTTARQHLIALYRDLGRHREAEAHRRALAVDVPDLAHRFDASLTQPRPIANGQAQIILET